MQKKEDPILFSQLHNSAQLNTKQNIFHWKIPFFVIKQQNIVFRTHHLLIIIDLIFIVNKFIKLFFQSGY